MDGLYNILVEGANAIISGYEAPAAGIAQRSAVMAQILSSFRTTLRMPRQSAREPGEGAFTVTLPAGWIFQGGVNRNNIGGSGLAQYSIGIDPAGRVMAAMPSYQWSYMDSGGFNPFGSFGGPQALPYMPAEQFCMRNIAPWMQSFQSGFKVEAVVGRPDLAELSLAELAQSGYPPGSFEASVATIETSYDENGLRLRQLSRVSTLRQRSNPGLFGGAAPIWQAALDIYYRAPQAEFKTWEPVLSGIVDSLALNPAWQAGEQRLAQNYIANSQSDIQRRTRQISQTLSETSDILTSGYWNRHANDERYSEMRQNAMMGVQNVASSSGEEYKVPLSFDRYWADGLGNLYGGSWMAQPDLNWKPLDPTGI